MGGCASMNLHFPFRNPIHLSYLILCPLAHIHIIIKIYISQGKATPSLGFTMYMHGNEINQISYLPCHWVSQPIVLPSSLHASWRRVCSPSMSWGRSFKTLALGCLGLCVIRYIGGRSHPPPCHSTCWRWVPSTSVLLDTSAVPAPPYRSICR